MIFGDFLKALGQIGDGRFLRVLFMGVGLSLLLLFAFTVIFAYTIGQIVPDTFSLPWIGEINWVDNVLSLAVIPVMIFASVFLMTPVASAFTGFFLDDVAQAVEAQHYPGLPAAQTTGLLDGLFEAFRFLGLLVVVNLLAVILYLIFAPLAPLIFWAVNGLLLGREYATLVAQRRLGAAGARAFRKANSMQIWLAGTLMAIPLTVPILNLFIPIFGVASFTHLFHRLNKT